MNVIHGNGTFECSRCFKECSTKPGLISHARKYHPQQVDAIVEIKKVQEPDEEVKAMMEKNETSWICRNCGKTKFHQFKIKRHIERVHLRRRKYSCSECNKSYLTRTSLNDHCRSHTGERPYSCHTCERTFFRRATLAKHKITHVEVQPVKCTLCDNNF